MYEKYYKIEMNNFLLNNCYKIIPKNLTRTLTAKHNKIISKLYDENVIDEKKRRNLRKYNFPTARIYSLPKIHKEGISKRPINAYINSIGG